MSTYTQTARASSWELVAQAVNAQYKLDVRFNEFAKQLVKNEKVLGLIAATAKTLYENKVTLETNSSLWVKEKLEVSPTTVMLVMRYEY